MNTYLAKTDAHRQGVNEAILLDADGYVTECTGANLFLIRKGRLVTLPVDAILDTLRVPRHFPPCLLRGQL